MEKLLQKVSCLALVALLWAFVSCAKEDYMPDPVNPAIEGTWIMTYDDYRYIADKRPEYHNLTREVTIAIDNGVWCIKGLFDKYRDTWIRCEYDEETRSITFPKIQLLRFDEGNPIFFKSGILALPFGYKVGDEIKFYSDGYYKTSDWDNRMYYSWDKNSILSMGYDPYLYDVRDESVTAFWYESDPGERLVISPESTSSGKRLPKRDFLINMSFSKKAAPAETSKCLDFTNNDPGDFAKLVAGQYLGIDSLIIRGRMNDQDFRQIRWLIRYGNLSVINLENAEPEDENSVVFEQTGKYNSPLHKIILPKHLKKIPARVFSGCSTLENMVIPERYESIGDSAFYECENIKSLQIPATCLSIGDSAFYGCENIKSLQIPATCLSIGKYIFSNCRKLSDVSLPSNLKKIPEGMLLNCHSLKRIEIPAGVDEIGKRAFAGAGLEGIDLPKGLKKIAYGTFRSCDLKEITIPDGVERIEESAFANSDLERIHLPKNLKYIGPWALESLRKLEELIFPASLDTIEGGACIFLTSLKRIYSLSATPPNCTTTQYRESSFYPVIEVPVFDREIWPNTYTPQDIPVYVPKGSADLYRSADGWSYFQNFIETDEFPEL